MFDDLCSMIYEEGVEALVDMYSEISWPRFDINNSDIRDLSRVSENTRQAISHLHNCPETDLIQDFDSYFA